MKRSILSFLLLFGIAITFPVHAESSLDVWTSFKSGTFATAFQLEFLTNADNARVFWSRKADATPADGLMYETPIEINRTGTIYFFAFTPGPDIKATQIKKAFFFVESRTGLEHFRIREIDPAAGTLSLMNYSKYPLDTTGWQIEYAGEVIAIKKQDLASESILTIPFSLTSDTRKILLRAPDGHAKQLAVIPPLSSGEVWRCETRRSTSCAVRKQ